MTTLFGRCKVCRWSRFMKQVAHEGLYCTRHPPLVMLLPTDRGPMISGLFPPVDDDAVCGEFTSDDRLQDARGGRVQGRTDA